MKQWGLIGCVWLLYLLLGDALFGDWDLNSRPAAFFFPFVATVLTVFVWGRVSKRLGL